MSSRILTHIFLTNSDLNSDSIGYPIFSPTFLPQALGRAGGRSGNTCPYLTGLKLCVFFFIASSIIDLVPRNLNSINSYISYMYIS